MNTDKPIYLPDTLPDYPGRDGTREGARRAAVAAMQRKPTQAPQKRKVAGIDGDAATEWGPMFERVEE